MRTLKTRAEFQRVQRGGRKWVTPAFIMHGQAREGTPNLPRFGFTVSSKSVAREEKTGARKRGKAVDRNRARRRLKEAVRLSFAEHARPDFDYVITGRSAALRINFAELLADMRVAFHKVSQAPPPYKNKPSIVTAVRVSSPGEKALQ